MKRREMMKLLAGGLFAAWGAGTRAGEGMRHTPRGLVFTMDANSLRGGETRPVLNPSRFSGKTREAYRAAKEIPDVLDHLYCYCECEVHSGHRSLKSCFADMHAANCDICQNEALMALRLKTQGRSLIEIRQTIDKTFLRS